MRIGSKADISSRVIACFLFPVRSIERVSYRRLETLIDVAKAGYWIELRCRCGHSAKYNPMVVLEKLAQRGGDLRLRNIRKKMKCGKCGGKEVTATHCNGPAIWSG